MSEPASFFAEHRADLQEACRRGPLVDLACGRGRHALAAARDGITSLAVDRNREFLAELVACARAEDLPLQALRFDLERGLALPLRAGSCAAVLVFRYLHRPLASRIAALLAAGGLLLYETFTTEQRAREGGPRNPAFLLTPGELPGLFPDLEVLVHEEGVHDGAATARLLARARPRGTPR